MSENRFGATGGNIGPNIPPVPSEVIVPGRKSGEIAFLHFIEAFRGYHRWRWPGRNPKWWWAHRASEGSPTAYRDGCMTTCDICGLKKYYPPGSTTHTFYLICERLKTFTDTKGVPMFDAEEL